MGKCISTSGVVIEEVVRTASEKFDEFKNRRYSRVKQEDPEEAEVKYEYGDHDVVPAMTDDAAEIDKIFEGVDENI